MTRYEFLIRYHEFQTDSKEQACVERDMVNNHAEDFTCQAVCLDGVWTLMLSTSITLLQTIMGDFIIAP